MPNLPANPPSDKPKLRLCVQCGATWIGASGFFCADYPDCRLPLRLRAAAALRWARDELKHFYRDDDD